MSVKAVHGALCVIARLSPAVQDMRPPNRCSALKKEETTRQAFPHGRVQSMRLKNMNEQRMGIQGKSMHQLCITRPSVCQACLSSSCLVALSAPSTPGQARSPLASALRPRPRVQPTLDDTPLHLLTVPQSPAAFSERTFSDS